MSAERVSQCYGCLLRISLMRIFASSICIYYPARLWYSGNKSKTNGLITGIDAQTIIDRINLPKNHNINLFLCNTRWNICKKVKNWFCTGFIGSILQVKPILAFKDGQVSPYQNTTNQQNRAMARNGELVTTQCPHKYFLAIDRIPG